MRSGAERWMFVGSPVSVAHYDRTCSFVHSTSSEYIGGSPVGLRRLIRRLREETTDPIGGGLDLRRSTLLVRRRLFGRRLDLESVRSLADLGLSPLTAHGYDDSSGRDLELVLNDLRLGRNDAVVDVGAGKGGALLTLFKYAPRRVVGVELSPKLVEAAKKNVRSLHVWGIEIIHCDAAEFTHYRRFNYIYMFNPFPARTMRRVMDAIEASLPVHVYETVTLLYRNPICHEEVVASGLFSLVATYTHSWNPINVYVATRPDGTC